MAGAHHGGEAVWESAEQKAERVVREELKKRRWEEAELGKRAKTDGEKVVIVRRLRRETVMTVAWIGQRLQMGSRPTVANCLKAS
jgi:hypothetical protein